MKIIYHSADLDGKCSAAIVYQQHPEAELLPYNYGDYIDWEGFSAEETVYLLDVSFSPEDMYKLEDLTNLTWIDHHARAIQNVYTHLHLNAPEVVRIDGIQAPGTAACELTWEYFHPGEPMPEAVRLLGRYDVWDHEDPNVVPFQMGMRTNSWEPDIKNWGHIINNPNFEYEVLPGILNKGHAIIKYQSQQSKDNLERTGFAGPVHGYKCYFANSTFGSSNHFESIADQDYDLFITYYHLPSLRLSLSLRSNNPDVDVSEIAAAYGGGGHRGAAGCTVNMLLDLKP